MIYSFHRINGISPRLSPHFFGESTQACDYLSNSHIIAATEDDEDSQAKSLQFPLHTFRNIAHNFPPTRLELLFLLFTHCAKSYFAQEERLPTAPNR